MAKPVVGILMGSDSDIPVMEECAKTLKDFGIPYEISISSAHRTPEKTAKYAVTAERRGIKIIIAGAGMAAHLAGFVAANTTLPVIGVPLESGALKGQDSLYSTVMMPGGIPVATVAIGKAGAVNAAILSAQMLSLSSPALRTKLKNFRKKMAKKVETKDKLLQSKKI